MTRTLAAASDRFRQQFLKSSESVLSFTRSRPGALDGTGIIQVSGRYSIV